MIECAYCNKVIATFGRAPSGELRFCNAECEEHDIQMKIANLIPAAEVNKFALEVHGGNCPKCNGQGPVDVHTSYRIWSAFLLTSWSSRLTLSCRSCATKQRALDTAFSAFLGWWGVPWGPLMTPVQLVRNIAGFFQTQDSVKPSPSLENMVRLQIAAGLIEQRKAETTG